MHSSARKFHLLRTILLLSLGTISALLVSCGDELQQIVDELAFVVELGVVEDYPQIDIVSEESSEYEGLLCEEIWEDGPNETLNCFLEKRLYPSGREFRIAVGLADYDSAGALVGYVANINNRHFYYGTADSGTVDCGRAREIPQVDLTVSISPSSNQFPDRAAANISEVLIQLSDETDYGCYFDAEQNVLHDWLLIYAPEATQCRPRVGSSFIPDLAGEYVLGWKLVTPSGADTDTITIRATDDHYIDYLSGMVDPDGPGICWDGNGFWYIDWHGVRKVNAAGSGQAFRGFPIEILNPSGVCCQDTLVWVAGEDGLGGTQVLQIAADSSLAASFPITALGVERPVLACDSTYLWIGEREGYQIYRRPHGFDPVIPYMIPDSLGAITDLASDGSTLWISTNEVDGDIAGLYQMNSTGEIMAVYPLEFINPMALGFDGTQLVCLNGSGVALTFGGRVAKLTLP